MPIISAEMIIDHLRNDVGTQRLNNQRSLPTMTEIGIHKTQQIAEHLKKLVKAEINGNIDAVSMPTWEMELLEDCRYAAVLIGRAVKNQRESLVFINSN